MGKTVKNNSLCEKGFDFDYWAELAHADPDTFDRYRQELIRMQIGRFPQESHERLIRFQWRLDAERERSLSALGACIRISEKMWDAFFRLDKMLSQFRGDTLPQDAAMLNCSDGQAEIITFPRRNASSLG